MLGGFSLRITQNYKGPSDLSFAESVFQQHQADIARTNELVTQLRGEISAISGSDNTLQIQSPPNFSLTLTANTFAEIGRFSVGSTDFSATFRGNMRFRSTNVFFTFEMYSTIRDEKTGAGNLLSISPDVIENAQTLRTSTALSFDLRDTEIRLQLQRSGNILIVRVSHTRTRSVPILYNFSLQDIFFFPA